MNSADKYLYAVKTYINVIFYMEHQILHQKDIDEQMDSMKAVADDFRIFRNFLVENPILDKSKEELIEKWFIVEVELETLHRT